MYFDVTEQRTLKYPDVTAGKILHEEAAIEEHEKTIPGNYGVTNAMAATAGKYTLHDGTVAVVAHSTDSLPAPSPEEEHSGFAWRSSWIREGDDRCSAWKMRSK